ncbi:DUF4139 domain-containing protein [Desulfosarcina sp. OttesenSCG-928-A07]|nr:DUF4139 domain-containing protein [Desulfosarcina sp. OttesenSCG-928-G17]MDL2328709.1 DUF4139 domain-containing protein [Desulfosarcina sp. OttesenSCG-928-A07]
MNKRCAFFFILILIWLSGGAAAFSASSQSDTGLPISRIALFSSGVGFFEHKGTVAGTATLPLPFAVDALDDVLKSLIVHDPGTRSPLLTYPAEETLERTLKSLKIDLSGNPGFSQILNNLRGAELLVKTPESITGRILGVETRLVQDRDGSRREEVFLSLSTPSGIRMLALSEISAFTFTDPKIDQDLGRALDLILSSRDDQTRNLFLHLPGDTKRAVSFAYVIPAPVWKVSYRLDLSASKPLLQGWAIVDNTGDADWENVELSLVTGRPVSFVQNLYQPYHLSRPVIPLAIAGYAEAAIFESGLLGADDQITAEEKMMDRARVAMAASAPMPRKAIAQQSGAMAMGQSYETTKGTAAGDQFAFTVKNPVSLPRQQSAMIPMVAVTLDVKKLSVFSGEKAAAGQILHPFLCAELVNTTGMKLPAGPITVFDGGTYAGDALVAFLPENEKRLIAFGEDLSVTGFADAASRQEISRVVLSKGVMTLSRRRLYERTYTFKNTAATRRNLVVEHPFTPQAKLVKPSKYDEKTGNLYRFSMALAAGQEARLEVLEELPLTESISLTRMPPATLLSYSQNKEIPEAVRKVFERAMGLKHQADTDEADLKRLQTQRDDALERQDRIRKNLEAAGNTSDQGKAYLKRLSDEDQVIDRLEGEIAAAQKKLEASKAGYETYLLEISVGG